MSNPYSTTSDSDSIGTHLVPVADVRGMKIITLALIGGVVMFMGVTLILNEGALGTEPGLLAWIGLGFFAVLFVQHLIIPQVVVGNVLKSVSADELRNGTEAEKIQQLIPAFRTQHIIGCALLEGPAFLNLVAYLIDDFVGNLAVAILVVVMLAMKIPSATSIQWWAEERIREIEAR